MVLFNWLGWAWCLLVDVANVAVDWWEQRYLCLRRYFYIFLVSKRFQFIVNEVFLFHVAINCRINEIPICKVNFDQYACIWRRLRGRSWACACVQSMDLCVCNVLNIWIFLVKHTFLDCNIPQILGCNPCSLWGPGLGPPWGEAEVVANRLKPCYFFLLSPSL